MRALATFRVLLLTAAALLEACVTAQHPPRPAAIGPVGAASTSAASATSPRSFDRAKQLAWGIYRDHAFTFYCNCAYSAEKRPLPQSCGYRPRHPGRRARIEWEHIVPAFGFGAQRSCWAGKTCVDAKGRAYGGRRCCRSRDAEFRRMEADLHNLVPEIGELNRARSNYAFGEVAGEPRAYGACDFEVDRAAHTVEPAPNLRGDIARAYLYMRAVYGPEALPLSAAELARFERWHRADPVSAWEELRNARIDALPQRGNALVRP